MELSPSISKIENDALLNESNSEYYPNYLRSKLPVKSSKNGLSLAGSISFSGQCDFNNQAKSNLFKDDRKSKLSIIQIESMIRNKEKVPKFNF